MSPMLALFGQKGDWLPPGKRHGRAGWTASSAGCLWPWHGGLRRPFDFDRLHPDSVQERFSRQPRSGPRIPTWKIETGWTIATLAVFALFFCKGGRSVYCHGAGPARRPR